MSPTIRNKDLQTYWIVTTDRDDVLLRERFMSRAKKPSGRRKAMAMLAVKHPRKLRFRIFDDLTPKTPLGDLFTKGSPPRHLHTVTQRLSDLQRIK